ncbi:hypothetical protein P23_2687 [Acinetobacter calcoaceticus]|nr:hypothetical protein P23_2687 [Acinetobacter calcoaceticus]
MRSFGGFSGYFAYLDIAIDGLCLCSHQIGNA